MSRDVTSPVVNLEVPIDEVDVIFKAAEEHIHDGEEQEDFFAKQNPAAKKLTEIVSETYDAMAFSLLKELSKVLNAK